MLCISLVIVITCYSFAYTTDALWYVYYNRGTTKVSPRWVGPKLLSGLRADKWSVYTSPTTLPIDLHKRCLMLWDRLSSPCLKRLHHLVWHHWLIDRSLARRRTTLGIQKYSEPALLQLHQIKHTINRESQRSSVAMCLLPQEQVVVQQGCSHLEELGLFHVTSQLQRYRCQRESGIPGNLASPSNIP